MGVNRNLVPPPSRPIALHTATSCRTEPADVPLDPVPRDRVPRAVGVRPAARRARREGFRVASAHRSPPPSSSVRTCGKSAAFRRVANLEPLSAPPTRRDGAAFASSRILYPPRRPFPSRGRYPPSGGSAWGLPSSARHACSCCFRGRLWAGGSCVSLVRAQADPRGPFPAMARQPVLRHL